MDANFWAAVSGVAAAIAAVVSLYQIFEIRKSSAQRDVAAQKLRAFEYTPAASPEFFNARQKIGAAFGGWYDSAPANVQLMDSIFQVDPETRDAFNYVLNHFGRMASAVHHEIIDENVARELFRHGFLGFWAKYQPYLDSQFSAKPTLTKQYEHSRILTRRWSLEAGE